MAHTKSQGAVGKYVNIDGKRRGVKRFGGEKVQRGDIIIRQKGTVFHIGRNVDMGRDFTIFSKIEGKVTFRNMTGHHRGQKYVDVVPFSELPNSMTKDNATKGKIEKNSEKNK